MLPYSRSNTFFQLCSPSPQPLLQGCLVIALLSYSNCPNRILPFRLHLDPCSQRPCLRKGPYVPSAFPCRWSVDRSGKAEPRCPASLLRRSTSETSREMFLLGWQGGDLPRV